MCNKTSIFRFKTLIFVQNISFFCLKTTLLATENYCYLIKKEYVCLKYFFVVY